MKVLQNFKTDTSFKSGVSFRNVLDIISYDFAVLEKGDLDLC